MDVRGTLILIISAFCLTGCFVDDPPPCTIEDDVAPEAECTANYVPEITFKVEYTTANGTIPSGRYSYNESSGSNSSQAETECKRALQTVFNTDQSYIDLEVLELQYYRGNICGTGFRLKSRAGEVRVKRVRKTGAHLYDYDLEFTCTNY